MVTWPDLRPSVTGPRAGGTGVGRGRRRWAVAGTLLLAGVLAAGVSGCSGPGGEALKDTTNVPSGAHPRQAFTPPSAEPVPRASVTVDASAAAGSTPAPAAADAWASAALASVTGGGNARSDVSVDGLSLQSTHGFRAATVTVRNSTARTASYAVRVDFADLQGKTVDSAVVGVRGVGPGASVRVVAFGHLATGSGGNPSLGLAQRY